MPETIKLEMTEKEAVELNEVLDMCLEKLDQLFQKMNNDQEEIEQYRAKTRAIIAQL